VQQCGGRWADRDLLHDAQARRWDLGPVSVLRLKILGSRLEDDGFLKEKIGRRGLAYEIPDQVRDDESFFDGTSSPLAMRVRGRRAPGAFWWKLAFPTGRRMLILGK